MKNCRNRCLGFLAGGDCSAGRRAFVGNFLCWTKRMQPYGLKNDKTHLNVSKGTSCGKRCMMPHKHVRLIIFVFGLVGSFFLLNSLMFCIFHCFQNGSQIQRELNTSQVCFHIEFFYFVRKNNGVQLGFRPFGEEIVWVLGYHEKLGLHRGQRTVVYLKIGFNIYSSFHLFNYYWLTSEQIRKYSLICELFFDKDLKNKILKIN